MTTVSDTFYEKQKLADDVDYVTDFSDWLQAGVTVSTATGTHTPPSGGADTITPTVATPNVTARLGPLSVTGVHYLDVVATMSNGEKKAVRYLIQVDF